MSGCQDRSGVLCRLRSSQGSRQLSVCRRLSFIVIVLQTCVSSDSYITTADRSCVVMSYALGSSTDDANNNDEWTVHPDAVTYAKSRAAIFKGKIRSSLLHSLTMIISV